MDIYRLIPAYKDYIWGGEKLPLRYGKNTELRPVAEAWELSVHPDGKTRVEGGATLEELLNDEMLGSACKRFSFFPVLVKFIDAKENLSVQVHPDDEYALAHESGYGKTEAWYIVEADEGAGIYLGFSKDVTKEEVEEAIREERLCELLNFYPVKKGECYFIPAGTVHAIGGGCLICEIQQNSNLTYRVYDYGRRDKEGKTRELHVEKALQVMNLRAYQKTRPSEESDVLASCAYFRAMRLCVEGTREITVDDTSFRCLICVDGEGMLGAHSVRRGDSFFIPAGGGSVALTGRMQLVSVEIS